LGFPDDAGFGLEELGEGAAMTFFPQSLHPTVVRSPEIEAEAIAKFEHFPRVETSFRRTVSEQVPLPDSVSIPLTTISASANFDAFINIAYRGQATGIATMLTVDSGNSMLVVPRWEDLEGLAGYTVLGRGKEPWGSPANIVRGPIEIPTSDGSLHTLDDCVFYACTGGSRTGNFGTGCITPWTANGWNVPAGIGVVMQSPLTYNKDYAFVEFNYEPADLLLSANPVARISRGSQLVLYRSQPPGYQMLETIQNLEWMSLYVSGLSIGGARTQWPNLTRAPIAMVDTGGGPVFLSDPDGYLHATQWPGSVSCPAWTSGSQGCQCVSSDISIELQNAISTEKYEYSIELENMPASVQGLSLVMCKNNQYMQDHYGMNIGGISALFNLILVDYDSCRVGLKPKG
jgi:hypothetical protein